MSGDYCHLNMRTMNWFAFFLMVDFIGGFFFPKMTVIEPQEPIVLLNNFLEMNCTASKTTGLNASQLYWTVSGVNVSAESMKIIGEQTLQFRKNITSISETGTYKCKTNNRKKGDAVNVKVEYAAVPNVTSFMCLLEKDALTCNWTLDKCRYPEFIDVKLTMSPDKNKTFHPCPVALSYASNSCTWEIIIPSYRFDFYLEVRSKLFGGTMPYSKLFYKNEILKRKPPVNINYKFNGTCVFLDWNVDCQCNTSLSVTSLLKSSVTQTRMLHKINKTVVCNLRPASSYSVRVQLIPVSGYHYSEQKQSTFTTPAIPPTDAPRVFPGGFSIDPDSKCNSDNAKRTVYIYWQRISKSSENGKNISYEISYNGGNLTNISQNQSSTSISVYCHVSYNVQIRARNEAGPSATSSLFLEKYKDLTPPSKIIVEQMGNTRALLTWYGIDKQASQYIVWCRKNINFECKDEINYDNWNNHTQITQDKVGSLMSEIMFGITQVKNQTGSGIIWQTCTYDREKEPSKMENVEIVDTSSENSLKVRWQPEPCALLSGNVFIILYRVFYCEVTIKNKCKAGSNQTIEIYPGERSEFTISGLKEGTKYGVSIQAVSETETGEISDMVIGTVTSRTKMEDLELTEEELAGIVSGSVFVFIFFTAGFIFTLTLIKHKCFPEKYEITVPEIETDVKNGNDTVKNEKTEEKTGYKMLRGIVVINTNYEQQISVDSGRGSLHSDGNAPLPPIREELVIVEKPKKTNNDFKLVNGFVFQNQDDDQRRAFGEIKNPFATEFKEVDDKNISNSDYTTMQDLNLSPLDISKQTLKSQQKDDDIDINKTKLSDQNNHFSKQITPTTTDCTNDERHSDYTKSDYIFQSNVPDHTDDMKSDCIYQSGAKDITYNPNTRSVDDNNCSHDMNQKKCSGHINCNYIFQSNAMSDIHIQNTRSMNEMNCSFDMNDTENIFDDDIIESNVTDNITKIVNENGYIYSTDIRAPSDHINHQSFGYILHSGAHLKRCSDIQAINIEKKLYLGHESKNGKKDTLSTEENTNCLPFLNTLGVEIQGEDIDDYLLSSSESQLSMYESDIKMSIGFLSEKSTNKNLQPIENQTIVKDDYLPLHSAMALWK